jgi:general stress protein 26
VLARPDRAEGIRTPADGRTPAVASDRGGRIKERDMTETAPDVAKVAELTKDIRIGMLTTVDEDGHFVSRPMAQQEVEFDGDLWFFSNSKARKISHIAANPAVSVTLSSNDTWVSLSGTATVVEDDAKAEELWNPFVEAWFPQGPHDDSVVLVKFTSDTAEYWDTPGGRVSSVISFVKAKVTGKRYDGGENETVQM